MSITILLELLKDGNSISLLLGLLSFLPFISFLNPEKKVNIHSICVESCLVFFKGGNIKTAAVTLNRTTKGKTLKTITEIVHLYGLACKANTALLMPR